MYYGVNPVLKYTRYKSSHVEYNHAVRPATVTLQLDHRQWSEMEDN